MHRPPFFFDWSELFDEVKRRGCFDSDAQLAEYLGLTRAQISAWRTGKSALGTLVRLKLLDALGYDSLRSVLHALYPVQERDKFANLQARLVERVGKTVRSRARAMRDRVAAHLRDDIPWSANFILAALPDEERAWLAPHLSCVQLPLGRNWLDGFDDGDAVYFPITAVISVALLTEGGRPAEMAVVGRDGLIGRSLWPRVAMVPARMVVQHEGKAVWLATSVVQEALTHGKVLRSLILNYMQRILTQFTDTIQCADPSPLQCLCRWLLLSVDGAGPASTLPSRPNWLASQLGLPVENVRDALATLAKCGAIIVCESATIQVRDRAKLEQHAAF
ncbi:Crp/Fnr family transcriptional regulator [Burkholderia cepacia]|uniref:Crp/Fnr family transcriptional regulator n=1 Tax=Burkholderia cepacia TaxID=292 RepID=UPI001589A60A|nr:Crp/Fnr family transcriptional regulator [Burkholderia cepacia]